MQNSYGTVGCFYGLVWPPLWLGLLRWIPEPPLWGVWAATITCKAEKGKECM